MKGVFVTGTDTDLGKTVVCSALVSALRSSTAVRYWKPVQTGFPHDDDTSFLRTLAGASADEIHSVGYRLAGPWSPHRSARRAGVEIRIQEIAAMAAAGYEADSFWIVEGAGGVLVPLNDRELMIDLIASLSLPVVVVARPTLGTINHSLLTLEALRARELEIQGVIINCGSNTANADAIREFGRVPLIAELPEFAEPLQDDLQTWVEHHRESLCDGLLSRPPSK